MKFRGNNRKNHLLIYCVLFMAILILIGPLYAISYNTLKDRVLKDSQAVVNRGMSRLDMEIEVLQNVRLEMQNNSDFIRMKNLRSFEEVRQYIIFKDFADYFKAQTKAFVLDSNTYIFFDSNNCVVSDKYQYDNMESIFNEHIKMEGMDWTQFRSSLFEKKEEFSAKYIEDLYIDGEHQPSIVISLSLSQSISQPEAMLVWIYSIDKLFEDMNLSDYMEVFDYISFNDKAILTEDNRHNQEPHQIVEGCKNINLKVAMDISEQYFNRQMKIFRCFLIVYLIALIFVIVCLEWFLSYWNNKPIRQMVKLVAKLTGDSDTAGKGIEYVSDMMKQINSENQQYHRDMLNFMFFKRPEEKECEFIRNNYPDFANPFFFAVFFGERINIRLLKLCMEKYEIKSQRILLPQEGECIVFFKYSKEIEIDSLREMLAEIVNMLKEYDVQTSTLISIPCNDVSDFYDAYQYIKSNYRFTDYSGVFSFESKEDNRIKNDRKHMYDSLYNNLIQGNAFEANQVVYQLWYQVMTNGYNSADPIRKMFYRQMGILEDVAEKVNYRGEFTSYDSRKKINDLAFSIAEDVENICSLISLRETQENGRIQEVISWMNEHFSEQDFCMAAMENQFRMSGKTIGKIIKSTTGKTFQEYMEELRIELAKKLISQPDSNMKAAAQECGFMNYDTFYKFFKKHTGVSPKQWKNNADITK